MKRVLCRRDKNKETGHRITYLLQLVERRGIHAELLEIILR